MLKIIVLSILLTFGLSKTVEVRYWDKEVEALEQVELSVGDNVKFEMYERPSTGYSWKVYQHTWPVNVHLFNETYTERIPPNTNAIGAASIRVFNLEAINVGTIKLQAIYGKAWETKAYEKEDGSFMGARAKQDGIDFKEKVLTVKINPSDDLNIVE